MPHAGIKLKTNTICYWKANLTMNSKMKLIHLPVKFLCDTFKIHNNLICQCVNNSMRGYICELVMLLLSLCSCFVRFHAFVSELLLF